MTEQEIQNLHELINSGGSNLEIAIQIAGLDYVVKYINQIGQDIINGKIEPEVKYYHFINRKVKEVDKDLFSEKEGYYIKVWYICGFSIKLSYNISLLYPYSVYIDDYYLGYESELYYKLIKKAITEIINRIKTK